MHVSSGEFESEPGSILFPPVEFFLPLGGGGDFDDCDGGVVDVAGGGLLSLIVAEEVDVGGFRPS